MGRRVAHVFNKSEQLMKHKTPLTYFYRANKVVDVSHNSTSTISSLAHYVSSCAIYIIVIIYELIAILVYVSTWVNDTAYIRTGYETML